MTGASGGLRKWRKFSLAVLGGMAIASIASIASIAPIASTPAQAADRIIEIRNGSASVTKVTGRGYSARVGTLLWVGDRLYPEPGTVVVVRCDNGTVREIRYVAGLGTICPDSTGTRTSDVGRGGVDFLELLFGDFRYATQVIDASPILQWNPVAGATAYQVVVFQGDGLLWQETVEETQVLYGGEPLELAQSYEVYIRAMADDTELSIFRLLLRRLEQDKTDAVVAMAEALNDYRLTDEARALALAQIYLEVVKSLEGEPEEGAEQKDPPESSGLILDAIAALEPIVEAGTETAFTHQLLGDLYLQIGLINQAQAQYEQVLELTWQQGSLATRAAGWMGLANAMAAYASEFAELGDTEAEAEAYVKAREYLEFAVINYRTFDREWAEWIEEQWLSKDF
ncbi:MAG: hypothetical protein AAGD25_16370 [Cyanobacteria bacterium P01_F01_bin.150]